LYMMFVYTTGPTMKLKRPVLDTMYKETIASLYPEPNTE